MCAPRRGPVAAGPHAWVEEAVDNGASGKSEIRLTVDVPFELASMADAELDVGASSVRLRGPAPACEEVTAPLPDGFVLDPELAAARFSRKKRQLVVTSPVVAAALAAPPAERSSPQAASAPELRPEPVASVPASSAPAPAAAATAAEVDDDDDDDMPPPLEAARSAPSKPCSDLAQGLQEAAAASQASLGEEGFSETDQTNEVATALMEKALAAREQKRKETEEARRSADLASGAGLKKGFLSGGKAKKTSGEKEKAREKEPEDIPFIRGVADPDAARRESLKMPEVQKALQQSTQKLKEDQSWVTPQLLQALSSRPDLSKAMSDPKIQEAMQLMQTDPDAAKKRYKDDPEVTGFLKDFTGLMATHFEVLGKEEGKGKAPSPPPAAEPPKPVAAPITGLDLAAKPPPAMAKKTGKASEGSTGLPIDDPAVMNALQDPEVQSLLAAIRAGHPFELHELGQANPRLFMKVKILLDSGLLAMQF